MNAEYALSQNDRVLIVACLKNTARSTRQVAKGKDQASRDQLMDEAEDLERLAAVIASFPVR